MRFHLNISNPATFPNQFLEPPPIRNQLPKVSRVILCRTEGRFGLLHVIEHVVQDEKGAVSTASFKVSGPRPSSCHCFKQGPWALP